MHVRIRSHKPILVGGLEKSHRKDEAKKKVGIRRQPCEKIAKGSNEDKIRSPLLGSPKGKTQQGRIKGFPLLGSEDLREIEQSDEVELEGTTMVTRPPMPDPLLVELIDLLVRPRGIPILVPRTWHRWICLPTFPSFGAPRMRTLLGT